MPRFVILEHDHPTLHWDLMLEAGEKLRTWRLAEFPESGKPANADESFEHRLIYLDYEGPISGGRGSVRRADFGAFRWIRDDMDEATLFVEGVKLRGTARLRRLDESHWSLDFREGVEA
jgi:hypothetical protein